MRIAITRLALVAFLLAASSSPAWARAWEELGSGARNPPAAVRAAQYLLRAHGHAIEVDGRWGAQTREKVRRFQRLRGLRPSGRVDGATWERLVIPVRRGSRGSAVRGVQSLLRFLASGNGDPRFSVALDGTFSAQTERAVRHFQRESGTPADGIVGPVTWASLINNVASD